MSRNIDFTMLSINNYKSIGNATIYLQDRGLILVEGQVIGSNSADSNGAGKTTIFDALSWCLYGIPIDGKLDNVDDVINKIAGKNCCVTVTFDHGEDQYAIARYRKDDNGKNGLHFAKNGTDITGSIKSVTQELISSTIGMDHASFCLSVIFGQGDPSKLRFTHLRPDQRQEVFEDILQMQWISKINDLAKKKYDLVLMGVDDLETEHIEYVTSINGERALISGDKIRREEFDAANQREIELLKENIGERKKEIDKLHDLGDYDDLIEKFEKKLKVFNKVLKIRAKIYLVEGDLRSVLDKLEIKKSMLKSYKKGLSSIKEKIDMFTDDFLSKEEQSCELCGQDISTEESFHKTIEKYEKDERARRKELKSIKVEVSELDLKSDELEEEVKDLRKEYEKKFNSEDEHKLSELKVKAENARSKDYNIERCEKKISEYEIRIDLIDQRGFKKLGSKKKLKKFKKERDRLNRKIEDLSDSLEYYEFFKFATASTVRAQYIDGEEVPPIRRFLIDSVLDDLNRKANEYADILTDGGMDIIIDTSSEKNEITVTINSKDRAESYRGSSGGEKNRANICITLSMQDLVRSRFAKGINLRVFDEVFESLDETGTERVVELLNEIATDSMSVFVITHQTHLKSYFDHTIKARWENGITEVIGG